MDSIISCEFGSFEPPQAAPVDEIVIKKAAPLPDLDHTKPSQQEDEDPGYLEEDWEAYESD